MRRVHSSLPGNFLSRHPLFILAGCFMTVQSLLFYKIGVFTGLEAEKYIGEGNSLFTNGHLNESKYLFYLPVIFLVYLCKALGTSYLLVVLVQVALSWVSLRCFYKLTKHLSNELTAFIASLAIILFIPLQIWNFYLYTESIFISLSLIYTYIVYIQGSRGTRGLLIILSFLIVLVFSRPHGILFIPPTMLYLLFRKQSRQAFVITAGLCILMVSTMYLVMVEVYKPGNDMDVMKPFIEEHIICFVPLKPQGAVIDIIQTGNPVTDLSFYITHNPGHFLRLAVLKLASFFNITRSYYSTGHNVYLLIFFIPVYLLSVVGLWRFIKIVRGFPLYLIALLVFFPMASVFQCDDWHSRFTMVVFPYFVLLAGIGLQYLFTKKKALTR